MEQIAWKPTTDVEGLIAASIRCNSVQKMDQYLPESFISDRIQALIDATDDPQATTDQTQRWMLEDGTMMDEGSIPAYDAGDRMVGGNPARWPRLWVMNALVRKRRPSSRRCRRRGRSWRAS